MDDCDSVMETPKSSSLDIDMTSTNQPTPAALDAEPQGAAQLTSSDKPTTTTTTTTTTFTNQDAVKYESPPKLRAFNHVANSRLSQQHETETTSAMDTKAEEGT